MLSAILGCRFNPSKPRYQTSFSSSSAHFSAVRRSFELLWACGRGCIDVSPWKRTQNAKLLLQLLFGLKPAHADALEQRWTRRRLRWRRRRRSIYKVIIYCQKWNLIRLKFNSLYSWTNPYYILLFFKKIFYFTFLYNIADGMSDIYGTENFWQREPLNIHPL